MFKRALAPLDNSEVAPGILPYVSYLARSLDTEVVLMTVIDPLAVATAGEQDDQSALDTAIDAAEAGRNFLSRFLEPLAGAGIQARSEVATGENPAQEILQSASDHGCDFIAMATRDRSLIGQAVMGSATNEVLRSARVPVLAITPEKGDVSPAEEVQLSSVLVPLDGSLFAEAALPYVEYLAQRLSLEVFLVRVVQFRDTHHALMGVPAPVDEGSARLQVMAEAAAEETVAEYLKQAADRLAARGLNVRWQLVRGDAPGNRIADLAQELPHNLIALASHGRSGIARWVVGSVAEDLLRSTGDPVLIIPSDLAETKKC